MVKIFSHLAQLTASDKFKQWAMRVIENEAKMYRRKRRQHLYESIDQSSTEVSEERPFYPKKFADWRDLPSDVVEQKEVREAVAKALAELPDIYRAIFVLCDMQHLEVAETAEALGLGESAVKTRLHRARLMMRESLTPLQFCRITSFAEFALVLLGRKVQRRGEPKPAFSDPRPPGSRGYVCMAASRHPGLHKPGFPRDHLSPAESETFSTARLH